VGSTALGFGSNATNLNSLAIGGAGGDGTTALSVADSTTASGSGAIAIGSNATRGAQATGQDAIAVGGQATAANLSSIAIGRAGQSASTRGIAIGDAAVASAAAIDSVAIGSSANVADFQSVAIGFSTQAQSSSSVAFGPNARAGSTATPALLAQIAIGNAALATGDRGVAIGSGANATGDNTLAIGRRAVAANAGAVALGLDSVTAAAVATTSATINGTTYTFAGITPASTVSVGSVGAERTMTNVAAGRISTTSTDAINGSQLNATNLAVTDVDARVDTLGANTAANFGGGSAYNPTTGAVSAPAYSVGGTTYNNVGDALGDIDSTLTNIDNGGGIKYFRANSTLADSTAVGIDSITAGPVANAEGTSAVAIGHNSNAFSNDSVALGRAAVAGVSGGNSGETALGATASATADNAVALGFAAQAGGISALAAGSSANALAQDAVALGNGATAAQDGAIALGASSVTAAAVATASGTIAGTSYNYAGTTPGSTVSIGDVGAERTLTNLAAGRVSDTSTDAINGSQLNATNLEVTALDSRADTEGTTTAANFGGGSTYDPVTGAVSAPAYSVGGTTYDNVGDAISNLTTGGATSKYFRANSTLADASATGTDSVAIGPLAVASAANAVALGNGATAAQDGAVAIGTGAVTAAAVATASGTIAGTSYNYAGITPASTLSIGDVGTERTLTNLAAGRVSTTSTDAINGSQLNATNLEVTALDTRADTQGTTTAANFGGGSAYDPVTGAVSAPAYSIGGTTYDNVGDALGDIDTTLTNIDNGGGIKYFHANSTLADSSATGTDSVAVGPLAVASAANAVALGNGATAAQDGAVALGTGSVTAAAVATASGTIAGTSYNYAGATPASTLSIGDAGAERTLTNLAAGRVSTTSTDAINGSQLNATNLEVTALDTRADTQGTTTAANFGGGSTYDPVTGAVSAPAYSIGGTTYDNVGDALGDIDNTLTNIDNGGGIKYFHVNSTLADSTAVGIDSLAAGPVANAEGVSAVAVGHATNAYSSDSVAVGRGAVAGVPGGTSGETALGATASATADNAVALGFASQASGISALAAGSSANASAQDAVALGNGATAAQDGAVALGAGSVTAAAVATASGTIAGTSYNYAGTTPASTVSLGDVGSERTLTNLAAGRVSTTSTDAINGSQLNATNLEVTALDARADTQGTTTAANFGGGSAYDPVTGAVSVPSYSVGGTTYNNVGDAITNLASGGATSKYFRANSTLADANATGIDSVAIGPLAVASATNAVALGNGATAAQDGAVALGTGSVTAAAVATASGTIAGTSYNYAGSTPASALSIGDAGTERTLTNLAAGRVSATSTDAINGSQLFANNTAIDSLDGRVDTLGGNVATNLGGGSTYDPATGAVSAPSYSVGGNTYNNVGDAISNLSTGGASSKYFRANSTLADASATGTDSVAVGPLAVASAANAVAMGNGATAAQDGAVALGAGSVTAAAVATASGMIAGTSYNYAGTTPASTLSIGDAGAERTLTNLAAGRVSTTSTDAINGSQLNATNLEVTALDTRADTQGTTTAANFGGGSTYDPATGAVSAPAYQVGPTSYNNVGDAIGGINTALTNLDNGGGIKYFHANSTLADSTAVGTDSLAAGPVANAEGTSAVAVGHNTNAYSNDSVAMGRGAVAGVPGGNSGETAVGATASATADNAVALGFASQASGISALAAGSSANASAQDAVALGNGATAAQDGAVALGAGSVTAAAVATASGTIAGTTYNYAGTTPASTVSLGDVGSERTLTNLAAGRVSGTSTDAINGSQLFATNTAVDSLDGRVDTLGGNVATNLGGGSSYDPATGAVTAPTYTVGGNTYNNVGDAITNLASGGAGTKYFHANSILADSSPTGTDSIAVGPLAVASGVNAVAMGNGAMAAQDGAVALGAGAVTAAAVATASGVIAGTTYNYAGATPTSTLSIGDVGAERTLTNLAAGRVSATSTDAVNGSQLFATNTAVATLDGQVDTLGTSVAGNLGGGSTYDPNTGTISAPVYNVGGTTYNNVGDAITNVDGRVTQNTTDITNLTSNINNGSVGLVQQDPATRTITVAKDTDGTTVDFTGTAGSRVLTGVANGAVNPTSQEAINGSQLHGVSQSISTALGGGSVVNPDGTVGAPTFNVGGNTYNSVGDAINHLATTGTQAKYFHANSVLADSSASGNDSVAIGPAAAASANNAVAMGNGATASHADSVALGSGTQTTVGAQAGYNGAYVGSSSSSGEVAIGGRQLTGVAAGSAASDGVNVSQLDAGVASAVDQANSYTDNRISLINNAPVNLTRLQQGAEGMFRVNQTNTIVPTVSGVNAAAGGSGSVASGEGSLAVGSQSAASGPTAVAIGTNAVASGANSVALGAGSIASAANTISVGSAGNERTVSHVAAGSADTDAVNVAQLRSSQAGSLRYDNNANGSVNPESLTLNPGGAPTTVHNVGAGVAPTDAVNVNQLQSAVGQLRDDAWDAQRESRGGNASAMAMAGMPQATGAGRHMLAMGVGGYEGEVGMAVGLSGVSDNGRYIYKAQVSSNTVQDFGFAVGAGIQW